MAHGQHIHLEVLWNRRIYCVAFHTPQSRCSPRVLFKVTVTSCTHALQYKLLYEYYYSYITLCNHTFCGSIMYGFCQDGCNYNCFTVYTSGLARWNDSSTFIVFLRQILWTLFVWLPYINHTDTPVRCMNPRAGPGCKNFVWALTVQVLWTLLSPYHSKSWSFRGWYASYAAQTY